LRHTKAHFTRAILESVAYMLRKNLALLEHLDVPVNEVRSIGGGAHSRLWLQIKADVLQLPVRTVANEEVACLGAALLAATATGQFTSLEEGAAHMVRVRETIEPQRALAAVYATRYEQYNQLYERLEPMFRQA
jgi:sugar (pentulose or hexulose) kinase